MKKRILSAILIGSMVLDSSRFVGKYFTIEYFFPGYLGTEYFLSGYFLKYFFNYFHTLSCILMGIPHTVS